MQRTKDGFEIPKQIILGFGVLSFLVSLVFLKLSRNAYSDILKFPNFESVEILESPTDKIEYELSGKSSTPKLVVKGITLKQTSLFSPA